MPYASKYYNYFQGAPEKERAGQRSKVEHLSVYGSLVELVECTETEEDFWDLLKSNSPNFYYLWNTTSSDRKGKIRDGFHVVIWLM
jgi:hypothetical protein